MNRVFIVEDDEDIRGIVDYALESSGFQVEAFEDGDTLFKELKKDIPDIILLDIMLPEEDGISILKRIRNSEKLKAVPVIMLTAKGSEFDKVKGLDSGADDYITKPFGVMELISRINAVLRRYEKSSEPNKKLMYKNIMLDNEKHIVSVDGEHITLTYKEYELLHYLLVHTNIVLSRDKILESIWGYNFTGETRTVDMHFKTLRKKLGNAGEYIKTIRNVGYRLGE